ncbi:MAG: NADP-dependent malic enzyme [Pseudomonadota bacterium]
MSDELQHDALEYHRYPRAGKLDVKPTKKMVNQRDLSLAYSPGVAAASTEIAANPSAAAELTIRSNLVGVVTNGTAVLGLGSIGPLAAKPVMEGKAALFKKFADINVFDIELNASSVDEVVNIVAAMEPTFGGINLEDIKAPECFEIEEKLREKMNIPVFHDDQHGTAICVAAAVLNGLRLSEKNIEDIKLVCTGAGAAAIACLNLLVSMGLNRDHVRVLDRKGVVHSGRDNLDKYKALYAIDTVDRTLDDAIDGADIFLGLSGPKTLSQDQVARMGEKPMVLALANPEPEILPELVKEVRPEALIATGRSDYPNQVNNVLCFPFMFRGALDVGATEINDAMKIACVEAIADLAKKEASEVVSAAYGGKPFQFGPEYLIPTPFDPRLMIDIPPRIAKAAMDSGVATRPIEDFGQYHRQLREFVFRSGLVMKPVFERAIATPKRIVFAEGESERVLSAAQVLIDDDICRPILIGRPDVMREKIADFGLRYDLESDVDVIDPNNNPACDATAMEYHRLMGRSGVSPAFADSVVRGSSTVLAALQVIMGQADAVICGVQGAYPQHLAHIKQVLGVAENVSSPKAVTLLILPSGSFFLTDTHATVDPEIDDITQSAVMASQLVKRFGMVPKVALLSHSNFGSRDNQFSQKMREARKRLFALYPDLAVEGEMHGDAALLDAIRDRVFPESRFNGAANVLVMPSLDAANISYNLIKILGDAVPIGPMLVGLNHPGHVLTDSVTVRGIVNMTAVAVVDAIERETDSAA